MTRKVAMRGANAKPAAAIADHDNGIVLKALGKSCDGGSSGATAQRVFAALHPA